MSVQVTLMSTVFCPSHLKLFIDKEKERSKDETFCALVKCPCVLDFTIYQDKK